MILIRRQSLNPSIPSLEERTNRRERILRRESTISFVDYRTAPCKTVSAIKVLNIRGNFYEVGFNNNMDFKCRDINMGFKGQDINMDFKGQDIKKANSLLYLNLTLSKGVFSKLYFLCQP